MDVALILKLIAFGTDLLKAGTELYEKSQETLSETDLQKIKAALAEAQAQTEWIRPQVDLALDAASKK